MSDLRKEELILEAKQEVLFQLLIECSQAIGEWENTTHDIAKAWEVVTDKMHNWLIVKKEIAKQQERVEELRELVCE